ncbi:unnamed protein product [Hermetia illucens]|uniref:Uncharacterized protein n=1 Tax=Hermetia illucens TaxID=343691 RepID=A0A7R8UM42_HERIL|nr:oocyte zinc finger protein XlCOF6.1-like [Hermetia illucens]CAD7083149.1 unnamed protein product [Hermetia illucens]
MREFCRICFEAASLFSIFNESDDERICDKIQLIANVQINQEDNLPQYICLQCLGKVEGFVEFRRKIEESDEQLRNGFSHAEGTEECVFELEIVPDNDDSIAEQDTEYLAMNGDDQDAATDFEEANDPAMNSQIQSVTIDGSQPANFESSRLISRTSINFFQCDICDKLFTTKLRLKSHIRQHQDEKRFHCEICSKSFTAAYNLRVHQRLHTGEKPHKCNFCDKEFSQSAGLIAHERLHTGESPFECQVCSKKFKTSSHLKYHMVKHTGEKNYICITCGKGFAGKSDLIQHGRTHTGERPYGCTVCSKNFLRMYHLQRHMLTHFNEKNFKCEICDSCFTQKYDLKRHMRTHKNKETELVDSL